MRLLVHVRALLEAFVAWPNTILLFVYSAFQLYACYLGIRIHADPAWVWMLIGAMLIALKIPILSLAILFSVPVWAFYGAVDGWGWPWTDAVVFSIFGAIALLILLGRIFITTLIPKGEK